MSPIDTRSVPRTIDPPKTVGGKFRFELRQRPTAPRDPVAKKSGGITTLLVFSIVCGVVLPLVTLGIEIATHMCGTTFFDPIPTVGHVLAVGLVPVANLALCWVLAKSEFRRLRTVLFVNAFTIGVASCYTLLFLPLLPLSVLAIPFGIGLLPLAPVLGLISAIALRRTFRRRLPEDPTGQPPRVWLGLTAGVLSLALLDLPAAATRVGLHKAAQPNVAERNQGVRLLRTFGDEDTMLRACYQRQGRALDLLGFLLSLDTPVSPDQARGIFYRVMGKPFDSVPAPRFSGRAAWLDDLEFDDAQGSTNVGPILKGLSLANSRLDASVDVGASLAYSEWTMVIRNDRRFQREARAQVKLPPGAVVSRVTLWIEGEEREAAFGGRAQTRQAYERVVTARRDPLLVTTSGPDRVLIQCFPVPPSGEMKIRIGVTQPLLQVAGTSAMSFPSFVERNFSLPEAEHGVWIEADSEIQSTSPALRPERTAGGVFALRGRVNDAALRLPVQIHLPLSEGQGFAWAHDPQDRGFAVRQRVARKVRSPVEKLIVVIDGSSGMAPYFPEIADALSAVPAQLPYEILVASDEVVPLDDARRLIDFKTRGGIDSVPALDEAYERAVLDGPGTDVLWIHGPQPVLFERTENLRANWRRRPGSPVIHAFEALPGINRVLESLDGVPEVRLVRRSRAPGEDLREFVADLSARKSERVLVRERMRMPAAIPAEWGKPTSEHLARLWASDEVGRLSGSRNSDDRGQAVVLAAAYQLVTPVSGAVVLETQAQYDQAGLQPADPATVPTIPEPEVWLLIIVASALLAWKLWQRSENGRRVWSSV